MTLAPNKREENRDGRGNFRMFETVISILFLLCLFVCVLLPICPSVNLLTVCQYFGLSVCSCVHLSVCPSVCVSVCWYIYRSICLSVHPYENPSIWSVCLSVCLSICLSVCLSVYHFYLAISLCFNGIQTMAYYYFQSNNADNASYVWLMVI